MALILSPTTLDLPERTYGEGCAILTKWTETIDANWKCIPDLIFETEDALSEFIQKTSHEPATYAKWCKSSKDFIKAKERHEEFAEIMLNEITELTVNTNAAK